MPVRLQTAGEMAAMDVVIRPAEIDDLDAVVAIYQREIDEGYATFETEPADVSQWREKIEGPEPLLVAATETGAVLGMAYATPFRPRPAYHLTRETSVYLSPAAQGQGLGTRLYGELLPILRASDCHTVLAMIALPNEASVRLHESAGFTRAGLLREVGHKFGRLIDVGMFQARP